MERLEAAALSAQQAAGWGLAETLGPLHIRCVESIRYVAAAGGPAAAADAAAAERALEPAPKATEGDEGGWHQDEWSVMTVVVVLSTTPDLRGGDRGRRRDRHTTAPPSPISLCFNRNGEGVSAE